MQKITISLMSLLLGTSAYATTETHHKHHKHHKHHAPKEEVVVVPAPVVAEACEYNGGFYFTAGGGYNTSSVPLKRTNLGAPTSSDKTNLGLTGGMGNFGLGFGKVFNPRFYAGLKGLFSISAVQGKTHDTDTAAREQQIKLRQNHGFSLMANMGVPIRNVLPYLAAGASYAKWELRSAVSPLNFRQSVVTKKQSKFGWIVGAGTDIAVSKRFNVGFEYLHTMYDDIKLTQSRVGNVKAAPATGTFNLMLKVKV